MENTMRLIARLRARLESKSNYAVAKALEMDQSSFNKVLNGKMGLGPKAVIKLSEMLNMDAGDVLVLTQEDVAKTPKNKEFWSRRSPRITASVAVATLAFGLAVITGQDARSATVYKNSCDATRYTLCEVVKYFLTFAKRLLLAAFNNYRCALTQNMRHVDGPSWNCRRQRGNSQSTHRQTGQDDPGRNLKNELHQHRYSSRFRTKKGNESQGGNALWHAEPLGAPA